MNRKQGEQSSSTVPGMALLCFSYFSSLFTILERVDFLLAALFFMNQAALTLLSRTETAFFRASWALFLSLEFKTLLTAVLIRDRP
jgi:preprotein translocase subunit SecG